MTNPTEVYGKSNWQKTKVLILRALMQVIGHTKDMGIRVLPGGQLPVAIKKVGKKNEFLNGQ